VRDNLINHSRETASRVELSDPLVQGSASARANANRQPAKLDTNTGISIKLAAVSGPDPPPLGGGPVGDFRMEIPVP